MFLKNKLRFVHADHLRKNLCDNSSVNGECYMPNIPASPIPISMSDCALSNGSGCDPDHNNTSIEINQSVENSEQIHAQKPINENESQNILPSPKANQVTVNVRSPRPKRNVKPPERLNL